MTGFDAHGNLHAGDGRFAPTRQTPASVQLTPVALTASSSGVEPEDICPAASEVTITRDGDGWEARATYEGLLPDVRLSDGSTVTASTTVRLDSPDFDEARRTFEGG
ncbi:hypothetical protein F8O07_07010 [Pseudoclavibacter sp. CFCC 13796]|uniref:hypothetical protein n=1 Tax=Pseudoclavibacter sp. CFCC 13796 TaxID=2615179 RepID=UPI001300E1BD|nr:hypothetical protein [Pseudoclavibacter sp. CFCC 13796]KAB1661649.1 hypothetical protein F8O07_07010 [Pseudoclavibacter sp. CFCC 13796]